MSTSLDFARDLAAALESRAGTWQFIRSFAADWLIPLQDGDGCSDAEWDALEARVGVKLPAALREGYSLLGKRGDLTSNHDVLLGLDEIHVDSESEALVFRVENQAAVRWGILIADMQQPDPPVMMRLDLAEGQDESWELWLASCSLAFLEIVMSESLHSVDGRVADRGQEDGQAGLLEQRYVRLPLAEYPISQTAVPGIRWFAGHDVLIRDDQRTWLRARARTTAALEELFRDLPGDWMVGDE